MYLRRPQQQKQAVSKRELERRLSDLEEQSKSPYSKEHVVDSAIGGAALGGPIGFGLGVKYLVPELGGEVVSFLLPVE